MTRSTIESAVNAPLVVERAHDHAPDELPVFAARTAARPRVLRIAGRAAAAIVALWLVGLLLGTLGLGYLPGIPFPGAHHSAPKRAAPVRAATHTAPTAVSVSTTAPRNGRPATAGRHRSAAIPRRPGGGQTSSPATRHSSSGTAVATPGAAPTRSQRSTHSSGGQPRRSSGASPGSRSHAQTAPGRGHSSATAQPGAHAPAKGRRATS